MHFCLMTSDDGVVEQNFDFNLLLIGATTFSIMTFIKAMLSIMTLSIIMKM